MLFNKPYQTYPNIKLKSATTQKLKILLNLLSIKVNKNVIKSLLIYLKESRFILTHL